MYCTKCGEILDHVYDKTIPVKWKCNVCNVEWDIGNGDDFIKNLYDRIIILETENTLLKARLQIIEEKLNDTN